MKPFVLLATRAEDVPADEEYEQFLRFGALSPDHLLRVRLESGPIPTFDLDEVSGFLVGGGPFNASEDPSRKSEVQLRVEREFGRLLDTVVPRDFPFLGACYGVGTLGAHQGAIIDDTYREAVGVIDVTKTDAGRVDPLLRELPDEFTAFVGHKEAVRELPRGATLLATSPGCPVQMFRVGQNVYATQFHPELDLPGITTRIRAYAGYGYFGAEELDATLAAAGRAPVLHTGSIIRSFVERYAR